MAQEALRRVREHKELGALATALGRAGSADLSLRSAAIEIEKGLPASQKSPTNTPSARPAEF